MSYTNSPNMNLPVPTIGVEPGAQYAQDVNNSLSIIDGHTHNLGSGVQITPSGLNINASLPMNNNILAGPASVQFTVQTSDPSTGGSVYVKGVDLYYEDVSGNVVQITSAGTVNATSSGISSGTATASFVGGVLVVDSASNTPGNIQAGSILIGNNVPASNFVTLQASNSLGSNYALTLPSVPAQTNVMTLDSSGNMGSVTYDQVGQNMTVTGSDAIASTMDVTGASTIASTMGATGANTIANNRTRATGNPSVGLGGIAFTFGPSNFSTTSVSPVTATSVGGIVVSGNRPVMINVQGVNGNGAGGNSLLSVSSSATSGVVNIVNNNTGFVVASYLIQSGGQLTPPTCIDTSVIGHPGTYTYLMQVYVIGSGTIHVSGQPIMNAFEL